MVFFLYIWILWFNSVLFQDPDYVIDDDELGDVLSAVEVVMNEDLGDVVKSELVGGATKVNCICIRNESYLGINDIFQTAVGRFESPIHNSFFGVESDQFGNAIGPEDDTTTEQFDVDGVYDDLLEDEIGPDPVIVQVAFEEDDDLLEDEIGPNPVIDQVAFEEDTNDYNDEVGDEAELEYGDVQYEEDGLEQIDGGSDNVRME